MEANENPVPCGAMTYRDYTVPAPGGATAKLRFTFDARDRGESETETLKDGLLTIVGWPGAPEWPMVWMHENLQPCVFVEIDDNELSDELKFVIVRCISSLLAEVDTVAPAAAVEAAAYDTLH